LSIFGRNFSGVTNLNFGIVGVLFTIESDVKITTTSPSGTGTVNLTVTNSEGTSPTTPSSQFTYIGSPILTTLNPQQGSSNGGTVVSLTGSNFTGSSQVTFGSTSAQTFTVQSDRLIEATSPSGTGTVNVTVTNPNGSTSINGFTYTTPAIISSISPTAGPSSGGNSVIITGSGFSTTTGVFCGNTSASFTIDSDTQVTAIAPSGTGEVFISLTNAVSTSNTETYDYINQPVITDLNPDYSPTIGNNYVTITGTDLSQTTAVDFSNQASGSFYINSDTQVVAIVPVPGTGTVNVTVTTPGGTSNALTFNYIDPPSI
jgi:hypothetical protein